jgi:hypothetical protein
MAAGSRKLLNVGGGNRTIALPPFFDGWTHHLLDIDARVKPDVLGDARQMERLVPAGTYDAIYCSHNIEHYYPHDVPKVLRGFLHALKIDGFAEIRCPDIGAVLRAIVEKDMDIDDVLYVSASGPIKAHDVIYGYSVEIERSGLDFFAHKRGFTEKSLRNAVVDAGFPVCGIGKGTYELRAYAFRAPPTAEHKRMLNLDQRSD